MNDKTLACVILAAGRGTRMRSEVPKILHEILERPMIDYVLDLPKAVGAAKTIVVLGYKHEVVKKAIKDNVKFVIQRSLLGSGDAVNQAKSELSDFDGDVLVLCGDAPLVKEETIRELLNAHRSTKSSCTILTTFLKDPTSYGRIVRDDEGRVIKITEELDATIFEKAIEEINVGAYFYKSKDLFKALSMVKNNNKKNEYFLTDTIGIIARSGKKIETYTTKDTDEIIGINSRIELAKAESVTRRRVLDSFMLSGVTIKDPANTYIASNVKIGIDSIIYSHTIIESGVIIGKNCKIGPFARIRPGSSIADNSEIGNFVEVVRTKVGENSKVKHHTYLGDAEVGNSVNIGCGTIVANYDGKNKSKTEIGDNSFIGSGTVLIAPVKIGKSAVTGAGSVVTKNKNVPNGGIVVGIPAKPIKKKR